MSPARGEAMETIRDPGKPARPLSRTADTSRAKTLLDWKPKALAGGGASVDLSVDEQETQGFGKGEPAMTKSAAVRVGLVGAGHIARFAHLPSLCRLPQATVSAICDEELEQARQAALDFGIPRTYSSLEKMLARERLDLVDICLPPHLHRDALVMALEQKVNCLVEKPLTMTTDDADTVMALAREKGVNLHVIHNYSVIPAVLKAKALVAKGAIGRVVGVHINYFVPFAPRHLDPEHWCHSLPGDYFSEVGPHLALLLVEFLGPVDGVESVVAKVSSEPTVRFDELRVIAQTRQGLGTIACSLNCPSRILTLDIVGTQGALHVNGDYQAVVHHGAIDTSMNAWGRGAAGAKDIVARAAALAWTSANVLTGRYALEIMGHRYLIEKSLRSLLGRGTYPIDTGLAREAVRLLELAFGEIRVK